MPPLLSSISYPPTMSSQTPVEVPSLGMTLGALYIGATIATMQVEFISACIFTNHHSSLFGITNTQVTKYYKKYPNDWWIFRYSVSTLCCTILFLALTIYTIVEPHSEVGINILVVNAFERIVFNHLLGSNVEACQCQQVIVSCFLYFPSPRVMAGMSQEAGKTEMYFSYQTWSTKRQGGESNADAEQAKRREREHGCNNTVTVTEYRLFLTAGGLLWQSSSKGEFWTMHGKSIYSIKKKSFKKPTSTSCSFLSM
ncbi:hypothetical protein IW262DRAFT_1532142 [Armillaria fumosa]|nr:hypothetical protein IW262DRAFT_1532142 [Armillaria fumosa]